jgi:hypothetical protein
MTDMISLKEEMISVVDDVLLDWRLVEELYTDEMGLVRVVIMQVLYW